MNSQSNLTAAKIRRMFLVIALVLCPLLATTTARGQGDTVTGTLTNSGNNFVDITGNASFTLTLMITTDFISSGITFFLVSNDGSGFFQLTARDYTGSPYPDPTSSDGQVFGGNAGVLNPETDFDLGVTNQGTDTDAPGTFTIALLTFSALNAPPGTYHIGIENGVVTDRDGNAFADRLFTTFATINVIPEPTTVGLAVIGGALLLVVAWRKQRA